MAAEDRAGQDDPNTEVAGDRPEPGGQEAEPGHEESSPLRTRVPLDRGGRAPQGGYDEDGRERDELGRVVPTRLNWLHFIRALPALIGEGAFDRRVPDSFYSLDTDDGTVVAVVACPCGEEPRVAMARAVECKCERFYLAIPSGVLVANSPVMTEAATHVGD